MNGAITYTDSGSLSQVIVGTRCNPVQLAGAIKPSCLLHPVNNRKQLDSILTPAPDTLRYREEGVCELLRI